MEEFLKIINSNDDRCHSDHVYIIACLKILLDLETNGNWMITCITDTHKNLKEVKKNEAILIPNGEDGALNCFEIIKYMSVLYKFHSLFYEILQ